MSNLEPSLEPLASYFHFENALPKDGRRPFGFLTIESAPDFRISKPHPHSWIVSNVPRLFLGPLFS